MSRTPARNISSQEENQVCGLHNRLENWTRKISYQLYGLIGGAVVVAGVLTIWMDGIRTSQAETRVEAVEARNKVAPLENRIGILEADYRHLNGVIEEIKTRLGNIEDKQEETSKGIHELLGLLKRQSIGYSIDPKDK